MYFVSGAAKNDTTDDGADVASDLEALDYPGGMRPDTGGVAQLTETIAAHVRAPGLVALAAAILIDQGKVGEALDQLRAWRDQQAERRAKAGTEAAIRRGAR